MASSECNDIVGIVEKRSRNTRGCPTACRRRFCYLAVPAFFRSL